MDEEPKFRAEGLMASGVNADECAQALRQAAKGFRRFERQLLKIWKSSEFQRLIRNLKRWDRAMTRRGIFPLEVRRRPISTRRAMVYQRKLARLAR